MTITTEQTNRPPVITIRTARARDLDALNLMIGELARHHGETANTSTVNLERDLFSEDPWISALVAESDGELIGFALMVPMYDARAGERGLDLNALYVRQGFRGQGIGQHLVSRAQDHARMLKCGFLSVSATTGNFAAHRFYRHLDFTARPVTGMRFLQAIG